MPGWSVIEFVEDNTVEVIPYKWLADNDSCFWPDGEKNITIQQYIKMKNNISNNWSLHNIKKLTSKMYINFEEANRKASKGRYTSDLSSSCEVQNVRKRRKPLRFRDTSSDSEEFSLSNKDDYPAVPNIKRSCFEGDLPTTAVTKDHRPMSASTVTASTSSINSLCSESGIGISEGSSKSPSSSALSNGRFSPLVSDVRPALETNQLQSNLSACQVSYSDDFQQVLRHLHILNARLRDHGDCLNALLMAKNVCDVQNSKVYDNELSKKIPIMNQDDLASLESFLNEAPQKITNLADVLSRVGGSNIKEYIRRILSRLISDEVPLQYSWVGTKGKTKFSLLRIADAVKGAVKNASFKVTEKEVENVISIWLSKAKERISRKMRSETE